MTCYRLTYTNSSSPIFFIPHERAVLLVKCDFSYSCADCEKIVLSLETEIFIGMDKISPKAKVKYEHST